MLMFFALYGNAAELSLLTYNVWFDDKTGLDTRYHQIITFLKTSPADIICLQEVTPRFLKQVRQAFNNTEYTVYGKISQHYGNITLTKLPVLHEQYTDLPSGMDRKPLKTVIQSDGAPLAIYNVHLDSMLDDTEMRMRQLEILFKYATGGWVVAGDFNFGDTDQENALLSGYQDAGVLAAGSPTYDIENNAFAAKTKFYWEPSRRLDRIIATPGITLTGYTVVKVPYSDHYPVRATLIQSATRKAAAKSWLFEFQSASTTHIALRGNRSRTVRTRD